ncbi:MAG: LysR family transcriptional regulator [Phycisphaerales bacterium]|nr:LysR family transcriptional regulator [Planctomycetota bacterium]MCH8509386.1 LysR family transcriptional regulator [Phycisphaerales bacterium]
MELHQLRYFVAAAEAGSMTLAAKRCRVAQPSLSQQVRRLEETLGVALFDRLGRGVVLTDAGRALLPRARRILAEVHETTENLRIEVHGGAGRLSIGAIPTMAPYLLPPLLASLRAEFPACELLVREDLTGALVEAVVDHELDVAITSTPIDHKLVEVEVVGREELLVVTPEGHPLAGLPRLTPDDLRGQATVTLHEMHCLGEQIGAFCARAGVRPDIVCRTTQLATVLEMVRLGMGVSLVPSMAAATARDHGLACRPLDLDRPTREIAVTWRLGRTRPVIGRGLARRLGHIPFFEGLL